MIFDEIDSDIDNYRILLMGDLLETATKSSVGAGIFETNLTIEEQVERAKELFMPYRDIIDGIVEGNHEARIYKMTGIDITKRLAEALDIPYLRYTGVVKYNVNGIRYMVNVWHGAGGGGTIGNSFNKCISMAKKTLSDIYAMGHTHKLGVTSRQFTVPRTVQVEEITQHFILTGSALDYDESYPDGMGLERVTPGFPIATMSGKKRHIDVALKTYSG
jgi:predicted phosphodiesterase